MKKILITGANSYVGTSFKKWVEKYSDQYSVDAISLRNDSWKDMSFQGYDVVLHTAAIVHVKERDITKYYKVNRDLTIEVAKKAKREGVKQFIFLSTMGVYGREEGVITKETKPAPKTPYAKSKLEAEKLLSEINSDSFKVAILRPPIVYGRDCPGNYKRLAKLAKKAKFFPEISNKRSMLYIDNLSEFIRLIIDNNVSGIYFPQNKNYVNTIHLVRLIAESHSKEIKTSKVLNWFISCCLNISKTVRKVFGSFVYEKGMPGAPDTEMNGMKIDYEVVSFEESILHTEGRRH